MSPIMMIGAGTVILVLGIGLGLWIGNIGRGKEMARTAEVKAEMDDYRRQVSEHFNTTALHFESIGAEYRRLYDHMAKGAGTLCDNRPSIFASPVEQIAVAEEPAEQIAAAEDPAEQIADAQDDEVVIAEPPRDYEVSEPVTEEPAEEIAVAMEPSDEELAATESTEELLAEHDITSDRSESEKTIH